MCICVYVHVVHAVLSLSSPHVPWRSACAALLCVPLLPCVCVYVCMFWCPCTTLPPPHIAVGNTSNEHTTGRWASFHTVERSAPLLLLNLIYTHVCSAPCACTCMYMCIHRAIHYSSSETCSCTCETYTQYV